LRDNGKYIDILAVSCDSFDEEVNVKIDREKGTHIQNLVPLSKICLKESIKFKLNTVMNKYNFLEDMNEHISRINPFRWKVFQVLVLEGENDSDKTLRVRKILPQNDRKTLHQNASATDAFNKTYRMHVVSLSLMKSSPNSALVISITKASSQNPTLS
jgi:MoaA/NifB/PqqE/SkfB family radical SAM enzyme